MPVPGSTASPEAAFHRKIVVLIGTGMFLDACDIYLAPGVLGALIKTGWFLSADFGGVLTGTLSSGFIGDRFGAASPIRSTGWSSGSPRSSPRRRRPWQS